MEDKMATGLWKSLLMLSLQFGLLKFWYTISLEPAHSLYLIAR